MLFENEEHDKVRRGPAATRRARRAVCAARAASRGAGAARARVRRARGAGRGQVILLFPDEASAAAVRGASRLLRGRFDFVAVARGTNAHLERWAGLGSEAGPQLFATKIRADPRPPLLPCDGDCKVARPCSPCRRVQLSD